MLEKLTKSQYGPILLLLLFLVIIGIIFLQDYGESIDEWHNAFYGELFLRLYETGNFFTNPGESYFNGPVYFMLLTVSSRLFTTINPSWLLTDGRHLTNFITFLVGGLFLYRLALRWLPKSIALVTTALFLTQPLLFGHAFINQKDIPFMVFFLISVELGLSAIDRWSSATLGKGKIDEVSSANHQESVRKAVASDWNSASITARLFFLLLLFVFVLLAIDFLVLDFSQPLAEKVLSDLYLGSPIPIVSSIFQRIATDAFKTPLEAYFNKLSSALFWIRLGMLFVILASLFMYAKFVFRRSYNAYVRSFVDSYGYFILAGVLLGLTTSIRIVGPLAGMLISILVLYRFKVKALKPLLIYWGIAACITYITWPVLWGDPIRVLLDRVLRASSFTDFQVLYFGRRIPSKHLPWHFVPIMINLQLTIPALVLFAFGSVTGWIGGLRKEWNIDILLLLTVWIALPVFIAIMGWIPIYNNFRHLLFILPSLFLLAGFGLERLFRWITKPLIQVILVSLILAPGVVGIVKLHPYEYIYYNETIGGVDGATGRFELDYWCTSFREVMDYVNATAPEGAQVAMWGGITTSQPFAREDLKLYSDRLSATDPNFAIGCKYALADPDFFPDLVVIHEVQRGEAILGIVKKNLD